jgi:hypothetical protein
MAVLAAEFLWKTHLASGIEIHSPPDVPSITQPPISALAARCADYHKALGGFVSGAVCSHGGDSVGDAPHTLAGTRNRALP